jgi:hypothetical protein
MHNMTIGAPTRIMTFLRCNLAGLIVGLMMVALPVTLQAPQRADAATVLDMPTGVTAMSTPGWGRSMVVTWNAVPNASSYYVSVRGGGCLAEYGRLAGNVGTSATLTPQNFNPNAMGSGFSFTVTVFAIGDGVNYTSSTARQCLNVTLNRWGALPTITTNPTSVTKALGESATFTTAATTSDAGTISYQWFKDGVAISSATENTYVISPVASSDSGSYYAQAINTLYEIKVATNSATATLTVPVGPAISAPTTGLTSTGASAFSLAVPATGGRSPLAYSLNGALVAGLSISSTTGTISGTPTATGSSTVSVTVTDADGATSTTSNFTITISQVSQSNLTLTSTSGTYGTDITLDISGGSGSGALTYAVTTTGTAGCSIISGTKLRATSPGTCTVTATKAASGIYSADSSTATTVTFAKKSQTALAVTTTSGDAITGITIATTGGSGTGAITSSVTSGTATCTLASGVVTAKTSGTCSLTVTKAADSTYLVESVTETLTFTSGATPTTTTTTTTTKPAATTTTTAAPALSIVIQAPVTTVAQGQATVATVAPTTTTTTVAVLGANGLPVPTTTSTTIASAKSKTVVTTTTLPQVVTTTTVGPPAASKVAAGQTAVQVDGVDADAKVSRENNQMVINAGSVSATLSGTDSAGKTLPLDTDGTVHLSAGDLIKVSVGGFEPKSIVEVWLFSTPTQLGFAVVETDGTMSGTYKLPFGVKSGSHRVVVTAKLPNGKATTFTLGVLIGNINKTSTLTRVLIAIPISLAVGFGFLLPTQARRRKRRATI